MKKIIYFFILSIGFSVTAQDNIGSIKGVVFDNTGEPIPFVNITVLDSGKQILGTNSDFDGIFNLMPLDSGKYTLQYSFVGFQTLKILEVKVETGKENYIKNSLNKGVGEPPLELAYHDSMLLDVATYKAFEHYYSLKETEVKSVTSILNNRVAPRNDRSYKLNRNVVCGLRSVPDIKKTTGREYGMLIEEKKRISCENESQVIFVDGYRLKEGSSNIPTEAIGKITISKLGISAEYNEVPIFKSNTNREVLVGKTQVLRYD